MQSIELKLCREVLRKLSLAYDADDTHDREIICAELFADVTGRLDAGAQAELRLNKPHIRFFEVLAPFYCTAPNEANQLLHVCRRFWGQPYVASIYTLLLHQWLMIDTTAGGVEERQKHLNVLVAGAQHLFFGDVHSSSKHLQSLFTFLLIEVVFSPNQQRLDAMPHHSRATLLKVVASFLPYYMDTERLKMDDALEQFPSLQHTAQEHKHVPFEGADYLINQVITTMRRVRTEGGLLRYLGALQGLHAAALASLRTTTRLSLQAELYSLTSPGGPRYAPRSVRRAAGQTLDTLFPLGQRSRRLVRFLFRVCNPSDWVVWWYRATAAVVGCWVAVCTAVLRWTRLLPRRRRPHHLD